MPEWLLSLIGVGLRFLKMKPGPHVEPLPPRGHEFPPPNSKKEWEVGIDRCYLCTVYDAKHVVHTSPPCPLRRPGGVELP